MQTISIATRVHGRVLFIEREPSRLLVTFHGYGETADANLEQVEQVPGIGRWSVAAVQALHPFYTRSGAVVASWMTSLDRERAIEDNLGWVRNAIAAIPAAGTVVFAGFSQGAAMAARAAARIPPSAGLILLGGDIPPEIKADASVKLPPVLLGRGARDEWYTDEKFKDDLRFLEPRTLVTRCVYSGGHEWTDAFREAAGEFLGQFD
jgi:predicted esterase